MIGLLLAAAVAATPPPDELAAARIAWRYFERNTDAQTGLVSSVDGYPSASTWDLGSSLIAAISARELGIVSARELEGRVEALLGTLARQPLYAGALPNKAYDTATARMTDYRNQPAASGIGFSAIDLGRLLSALVLLGELYPEHRPPVERVLARWDTCRVVRGGELHGAHAIGSGAPADTQEGRLGYEQYAAKAFALLGHDVSAARRYDRFAAEVSILGVGVPRDRRSRERYGALDAVVTEPWVLDALEFGLDREAVPLAQRVFEVQKRRWESTGIVTALSEDHVDRAPWFVYDSIWADGTAWRTVTPDGADVAGLRGVSTKAALALAALYPGDPYAKVLRQAVSGAFDPERGWYAGVYEDGGGLNRALSANTNGVVLEAALFARLGPLHQAALRRPGAVKWRAQLARLGPEGRTCLAPIRDASLTTLAPAPAPPPARSSLALEPPRPRGGRRAIATGELVADYRGTDGPGYGGLATVSPRPGWFLRLGGDWTPVSTGGRARFLWGFGYDDWHDRTLSVTVHDWGPVRPEDGIGSREAELNVGYKVPRLCSSWFCGALFPSVTVPFGGGPYLGARLTFTVAGSWFVMGGLGWTVPGVLPGPAGTPRWRMVYGFGRRDWQPGSVFVTYYDWGPDERARNGILAVGVNWGF